MISLKDITRQVGADSAALMVPNETERHNYCYASYNMPPEWSAIKNSFDEDVHGGNVEVYKTGEPAISNHLNELLEGHHLESVMIVPVNRNNKTIAMLELVRSLNKNEFTNQELKKAQKFAKNLEPRLPDQL